MSADSIDDIRPDPSLGHLPGKCVETLDAASWACFDIEDMLRAKLQEFADEIDAIETLRSTF
ncbi:MAG: hypothetical protein KDI28_03995 [Pseudomonadales bacterium]|nr:hypothetical protein [Pseudomonadales bacterium]